MDGRDTPAITMITPAITMITPAITMITLAITATTSRSGGSRDISTPGTMRTR